MTLPLPAPQNTPKCVPAMKSEAGKLELWCYAADPEGDAVRMATPDEVIRCHDLSPLLIEARRKYPFIVVHTTEVTEALWLHRGNALDERRLYDFLIERRRR